VSWDVENHTGRLDPVVIVAGCMEERRGNPSKCACRESQGAMGLHGRGFSTRHLPLIPHAVEHTPVEHVPGEEITQACSTTTVRGAPWMGSPSRM
jgi:hypothetical protein